MSKTKLRRRRKRRDRNLDKLVELMLARHLRISVPQSKVRDKLARAQRLTAEAVDLVERPMRCIAVTGAGASAPLIDRANKLASKLEGEFGRNEDVLERLELVNNLNPKLFETRLIALSQTPDAARRVRETISREYNIHHPTVLAYELLAHMLKHRFLDAIISFNFDELLDRSLDDELDPSEYRSVVSERDCTSIQSNADAPDYVPLYIKLHGTASEPDSLRFTPDSYYSLPPRVVEMVQDLMHTEHCVVVTVGSAMASFDFHQLLAIPTRLDVFNLSLKKLNKPVRKKIHKERKKIKPKGPKKWLHECSTGKDSCDRHIKKLTGKLQARTLGASAPPGTPKRPGTIGQLVHFRSVRRHEVIAGLLGSGAARRSAMQRPSWHRAATIDYLQRRTILELAFAGAKSRGLLSIGPLASDRPAQYYERYRQKLDGGRGWDWNDFCSAAGLVETKNIPDVLMAEETLQPAYGARTRADETHELHEFRPDRLARHVLSRVGRSKDPDDLKLLTQTIRGLQKQSDVELHTQDDRVCSKVFGGPVTLTTTTALKAYTWLMLRELKPGDEIYISSETGEWLLQEPILKMLQGQLKIRALLAFDIKRGKLHKKYRGLKAKVINPWHHNRHMTIVCDGEVPSQAIYFARHLRTPVITAVYLNNVHDVQHLKKTFDRRWQEAKEGRG